MDKLLRKCVELLSRSEKHFSSLNLSKRQGENWGDFNERSNLRESKIKTFWVLKRSDMPSLFSTFFHPSKERKRNFKPENKREEEESGSPSLFVHILNI